MNISALARTLDITPSQLFGWRRAATVRAKKVERQAPVEARAARTRRVEIEIGGAVLRVSADIEEADLRRLLARARGCRARVLLRAAAVDFRKGPEGLVALVRDAGADPFICSGLIMWRRSPRAPDSLAISDFAAT